MNFTGITLDNSNATSSKISFFSEPQMLVPECFSISLRDILSNS